MCNISLCATYLCHVKAPGERPVALRLARHSLLQTLQPLRPVASFPDAGLVTSVVLPQTASASLFYIGTPKASRKRAAGQEFVSSGCRSMMHTSCVEHTCRAGSLPHTGQRYLLPSDGRYREVAVGRWAQCCRGFQRHRIVQALCTAELQLDLVNRRLLLCGPGGRAAGSLRASVTKVQTRQRAIRQAVL